MAMDGVVVNMRRWTLGWTLMLSLAVITSVSGKFFKKSLRKTLLTASSDKNDTAEN